MKLQRSGEKLDYPSLSPHSRTGSRLRDSPYDKTPESDKESGRIKFRQALKSESDVERVPTANKDDMTRDRIQSQDLLMVCPKEGYSQIQLASRDGWHSRSVGEVAPADNEES